LSNLRLFYGHFTSVTLMTKFCFESLTLCGYLTGMTQLVSYDSGRDVVLVGTTLLKRQKEAERKNLLYKHRTAIQCNSTCGGRPRVTTEFSWRHYLVKACSTCRDEKLGAKSSVCCVSRRPPSVRLSVVVGYLIVCWMPTTHAGRNDSMQVFRISD